jgi:hypothetical protein
MERIKHGYGQAIGYFAHNRAQVGVIELADSVLVGEQRAQDGIHQFCLDQAVGVKQGVVSLQKEVMIWTQLPSIRGESDYVDRSGVTAEGITGDNKRRVPVEDALFFNAWREGRVTKIDPIHHAALHGRLVRQCIRFKIWWVRHCLATYLLLRTCQRDWRSMGRDLVGFQLSMKAGVGK